MSARDLLEMIAVASNAVLWGGIILGFVWLSITDPTVPDDTPSPSNTTQGVRTDAAPRHRA
jgi:hypothetical protein